MGQESPFKSTRDESLTVIDNRTGKQYKVPIAHNAIPATSFKSIRAPSGPNDRPEDESERGLRVSDRGFLNTAVVQSSITYIDGDNGILRYRGYPIEQLASQSSFLDCAYLLIYGSLPTHVQLSNFEREVLTHGVNACRRRSAFAYLGSYYSEANPSLQGQALYTNGAKGDVAALRNMDKQIYRLIGKATTLAAMAYRVRQGREFVVPPTGMSYAESGQWADTACRFLFQLDHSSHSDAFPTTSTSCGVAYKPHPVLARALDILFILHADHEMNASSTTVLQTGSSLPDPYSAIAAGCASLYGPLHGGANEAVIRMLVSIESPENVPEFLAAVKRREKVLSGFGHRVYKTSDPRSFIIRKVADEVFAVYVLELFHSAARVPIPLLKTAMALHDAALKDDYFVSRKLAPNVDFWRCGVSLRMPGFPMDFFPVLFVVPRVVGWLAHWRQMMLSPEGVKIWRPRQIYVGPPERTYVPVEERQAVEGTGKEASVVAHSGITKRRRLVEEGNVVKSRL
ncbi:citrate synthase-like protein [Chiua virens]|nr:citrate synthase-like protein [Chiua virens]